MLSVSNDRTQFGARYIAPVNVKGKYKNKWHDINVNLIKFETNLGQELSNIEAVKYIWGGKNLSASVAEEARKCGGLANVYALTRQQANFEKVIPSEILGIMTTGPIKKGEETVEIFKIGAHPRYAYEQNRRSRDVKHIASGMVEAFRQLAKESGVEPVVLCSEPREEKFLRKVGLKPVKENLVELIG